MNIGHGMSRDTPRMKCGTGGAAPRTRWATVAGTRTRATTVYSPFRKANGKARARGKSLDIATVVVRQVIRQKYSPKGKGKSGKGRGDFKGVRQGFRQQRLAGEPQGLAAALCQGPLGKQVGQRA